MNNLDEKLNEILEQFYKKASNWNYQNYDFEKYLVEAKAQLEQYIEDRILEARIDELTSLQHHGKPTQSYVWYSDIEYRLKALNKEGEIE